MDVLSEAGIEARGSKAMGKTTEQKAKDLVAVYAAGIRVHAAERGSDETLCGHRVVTVGAAARVSNINCKLCKKIADGTKVVLRPRAA
jgi:hypothetical protein